MTPGSVTSVFGEAEDFAAALSAEGVLSLLVTATGEFRARLTRPRGNAFNGTVKGVPLAIGEAAERSDHLVSPEEAIRIAMGRQ